jgi:phage terminase small subunit
LNYPGWKRLKIDHRGIVEMAVFEGKPDWTDRMEKFCYEYIADLNATQAAIRAGYSEDSARQIGTENLSKPSIQQRIAEIRAELNLENGNLARRVINELKLIGFSNIQDYIESSNNVTDLTQVNSDKARVISSVKKSVTTFGDGEGNEGTKETVEFKLWDKIAALEKLGRHLGIFEADNKQKSAVITVSLEDKDDENA